MAFPFTLIWILQTQLPCTLFTCNNLAKKKTTVIYRELRFSKPKNYDLCIKGDAWIWLTNIQTVPLGYEPIFVYFWWCHLSCQSNRETGQRISNPTLKTKKYSSNYSLFFFFFLKKKINKQTKKLKKVKNISFQVCHIIQNRKILVCINLLSALVIFSLHQSTRY